jgi:hypothetical protein
MKIEDIFLILRSIFSRKEDLSQEEKKELFIYQLTHGNIDADTMLKIYGIALQT